MSKATNPHQNAPILELGITDWDINQLDEQSIVDQLEKGSVIYLPSLAFPLMQNEQTLLNPKFVHPKRKNIMYQSDIDVIRGIAEDVTQDQQVMIKELLKRYAILSYQLVTRLIPEYQNKLSHPMNTLRLNAIDQWSNQHSFRKDDRRLHVDAFPSRPLQGKRILRIFNNINPNGVPRQWRVGENFSQLAEHLLPKTKAYSRLNALFLDTFGITKSRRTHYDHLMLQFHDLMKEDEHYQQNGIQWNIDFMPGSTWICFSDQMPHAAMSGQFMLEQTFQLDVENMVNPQYSPLKVLEAMIGKTLL